MTDADIAIYDKAFFKQDKDKDGFISPQGSDGWVEFQAILIVQNSASRPQVQKPCRSWWGVLSPSPIVCLRKETKLWS